MKHRKATSEALQIGSLHLAAKCLLQAYFFLMIPAVHGQRDHQQVLLKGTKSAWVRFYQMCDQCPFGQAAYSLPRLMYIPDVYSHLLCNAHGSQVRLRVRCFLIPPQQQRSTLLQHQRLESRHILLQARSCGTLTGRGFAYAHQGCTPQLGACDMLTCSGAVSCSDMQHNLQHYRLTLAGVLLHMVHQVTDT